MIEPVFQLTALAAAAGAIAWASAKAIQRVELSLAKHPSLTGHVRWAKRITGQLPGYRYEEQMFFASDGAPDDIVARRKAGFQRLASTFAGRFAQTVAVTGQAREMLSDLQFTSAYRVPFQYSDYLRRHLSVGGGEDLMAKIVRRRVCRRPGDGARSARGGHDGLRQSKW